MTHPSSHSTSFCLRHPSHATDPPPACSTALPLAPPPAAGKDILDFYSDPKTRALYKLNIWGLLRRVNPLTGLAPKDDPTIFSFNIINEPRCPGAQC